MSWSLILLYNLIMLLFMTSLVLYDSMFDYMAFEFYSEIDIDISNKSDNRASIQQMPLCL